MSTAGRAPSMSHGSSARPLRSCWGRTVRIANAAESVGSYARRECPPSTGSGSADVRSYVEQLREELELEGLLEERDAGRSSGAALEPDDALDGLEVSEPPQLEAALDVDELLAHLVGGPVRVGVGVDPPEHLGH